jgi:hypothetical protein
LQVREGTNAPEWNEDFMFLFNAATAKELTLKV